MMIDDMKKNELTETEMDNVSGGMFHTMREMKLKQEEELKKRAEEAKKKAEEARKQAETATNPSIHAHGGGVSGSW